MCLCTCKEEAEEERGGSSSYILFFHVCVYMCVWMLQEGGGEARTD
jgi:hypothetical protein